MSRVLTGPAAAAGPAGVTPPPRPGLIRRTTTHDSLRHAGLAGPVTLDARGRDLLVGGSSTVLAFARLAAEIDFPGQAITSIAAEPAEPRLAALVGTRASSGFRRNVADALPGERDSHSVRFQLLDDMPGALLVNGYAVQQAGALGSPRPVRAAGPRRQYPDLCAGWIAGGTLVTGIETTGMVPKPTGPVVGHLEDDPDGWHAVAPLPAHGMRRARRLDVWREPAGIRVECFFRDSHRDSAGVESALHEYTVHATVDPGTGVFTSSVAEFGALPWLECPMALASAGRIVGLRPDGLRRHVRDAFTGVSTCTHLNDTLRALEDVGALIDLLPASEDG